MRALWRITLSLAVLVGCGMAQRGGGHGGGGGFHASAGGGSGHASAGGYRGGSSGVAHMGAAGSGYHGGYGHGGWSYGHRGYGYRGGYWPWYGFGFSYWPSYYYGYYNYYPYDYYYPDTYSQPVYVTNPAPAATYTPAPAMTYPPAAYNSYDGPVHPVIRSYDEYGQETGASGEDAGNASPIYLIALKDGEIQAAGSYWMAGQTLHYVTLDRQEKQVALGSINRQLTGQLNRERRVSLNLPPD